MPTKIRCRAKSLSQRLRKARENSSPSADERAFTKSIRKRLALARGLFLARDRCERATRNFERLERGAWALVPHANREAIERNAEIREI